MTSSALIDNATISGVQRLLGKTQIGNLRFVDIDILCLEKLIRAILFFDDLYFIDDYKEHFRSIRRKTLPFLEPLDLENGEYENLANSAAEYASHVSFEMRNWEPVDTTLSFFENLSLSPQMRWDIFVSSQYLTLSYLTDRRDDPLVGAIAGSFGQEISDHSRTELVIDTSATPIVNGTQKFDNVDRLTEYLKSKNPDFKGVGHQDTLGSAVFAYGWIAERSHFYENAAASKTLTPMLHPMRDAYCASAHGLQFSPSAETILDALADQSSETIVNFKSSTDLSVSAFAVPLFVAWLAERTGDVSKIIDEAFSIRDEDLIKQARHYLTELVSLRPEDRAKESGRLLEALSEQLSKTCGKYMHHSKQGPAISVGFSLFGFSLGLADLSPFFAGKNYGARGQFVNLYQTMAKDLLSIERLGMIHDVLTSNLRETKNSNYKTVSTTPIYMRKKESDYSRRVSE